MRKFNFQKIRLHSNINICHLKPKLDEVKLLLSSGNNVDVLGICETFLNKNVDEKTINIDSYKIERKDRENCNMLDKIQGGGIIIYIAVHVNYVRRTDLETPTIESIWVEIRIPNSSPFLICSVYRPQSAKAERIDTFSNQLEY